MIRWVQMSSATLFFHNYSMDGSNIFVRIVHFDIKVKIKGCPKIKLFRTTLN